MRLYHILHPISAMSTFEFIAPICKQAWGTMSDRRRRIDEPSKKVRTDLAMQKRTPPTMRPRTSKPLVGVLGDVDGRIVPG